MPSNTARLQRGNKMSTANLKSIASSLNNGKFQLAVSLALLEVVEVGNQVYLPNAYELVCSKLSKSQFAGYLSTLERTGMYQSQDDKFFGLLK